MEAMVFVVFSDRQPDGAPPHFFDRYFGLPLLAIREFACLGAFVPPMAVQRPSTAPAMMMANSNWQDSVHSRHQFNSLQAA